MEMAPGSVTIAKLAPAACLVAGLACNGMDARGTAPEEPPKPGREKKKQGEPECRIPA
jgi:hypothetical protein